MISAEQPAADAAIRLLEHSRLRISLRVGVVLVHFLLAGSLWLLLNARSRRISIRITGSGESG